MNFLKRGRLQRSQRPKTLRIEDPHQGQLGSADKIGVVLGEILENFVALVLGSLQRRVVASHDHLRYLCMSLLFFRSIGLGVRDIEGSSSF